LFKESQIVFLIAPIAGKILFYFLSKIPSTALGMAKNKKDCTGKRELPFLKCLTIRFKKSLLCDSFVPRNDCNQDAKIKKITRKLNEFSGYRIMV